MKTRKIGRPGARKSAESGLLLACAKDDAPARARDYLASSDLIIDWDLLIRMAARHGVLPLVHTALRNSDMVPREAMERMKREFAANALNTLFLAKELARLTGLFQTAGIKAVTFKGPVLALAAYGGLAMRQFSDLDILVSRDEVPRIAEILIEERYLPRRYRPETPAASLARYFEDEFIKENGTQLVDLHWELTPAHFRYGPSAKRALAQALPFRLDGTELLTVSTIDTLLFLCVHGAKHGWVCLGWVVDVARMLAANPDLDVDALIKEAQRTGCVRMMLLAMILARDLAGATIADPIAQMCSLDAAVRRLALDIEARMFVQTDMRPTLFAEWGVPLRTIERTRDRVNHVVVRALHPTIEDCEFIELPDALYPLYFLLRPMRLALQQGRRLVGDVPMVAPFKPRKVPR